MTYDERLAAIETPGTVVEAFGKTLTYTGRWTTSRNYPAMAFVDATGRESLITIAYAADPSETKIVKVA